LDAAQQMFQPLSAIRPVRFDQGGIIAVDQRKLPGEYTEIFLSTPDEIAAAIRTLAVRGAPLLGITAAYGAANAAYLAQTRKLSQSQQIMEVRAALDLFRATRPTARDMFAALSRIEQVCAKPVSNLFHSMLAEAREIHQADLAASAVMAVQAPLVLQERGWVMTICNTGALATGGGGTALAVIAEGHRLGLVQGVYVLETRPLLQGARLTAWELQQAGIPHQVICDSAAADVLQRSDVTAIFTGADRIARNGDTANKVGTYMLAVLANHHNVPLFICAPQSTFDAETPNGAAIPIEQRAGEEVFAYGVTTLATVQTSVYNPAFDVTPAQLVTGYICEHGVFSLTDLEGSPVWNSL
jgi:methylthioribose-1-phosphate isomerase